MDLDEYLDEPTNSDSASLTSSGNGVQKNGGTASRRASLAPGRGTLVRSPSYMTTSAKQNVQVYCRIRPPVTQDEADEFREHGMAVEVQDNAVIMRRVDENKADAMFSFDAVFDPNQAQDIVFNTTAAPLVAEVFAGYNCTIFAYGQTGSGKTHTMMGVLDSPQRGIIPRLVEQIFLGIETADENLEFTLKVSYVEIYMEHIRDLLHPRKDNLQIRETVDGDVYIKDVTEIYVNSNDQVLDIMHKGMQSRAIGATRMNEQSSRSHSVFILSLGQRDKSSGSKKISKLFLVDLAGSEKVQKSHAAGQLLEEAKHINKSLSSLGNVIYHLTEGKQHVPYRDSKLTRLLNDSLGGNSKTSLIITCSPTVYNTEETLSTLRFGARAKRIKNKPKVNQEKSVAEYQAMLRSAAKQISKQQELIKSLDGDVLELKNMVLRLSPGYDPNNPQTRGQEEALLRQLQGVHVVGDLQKRIEELELKNAETEEQNQQLKEQLIEKDSELDIQTQMVDDKSEEVNQLKIQVKIFKEQAEKFEEKVAEYAVFRKKVELMEQEYIIQLDELEVENADLTEKLHALLLNEIESRHAQAMRARQRKQERPKRQSQTGITPRLVDEAAKDARSPRVEEEDASPRTKQVAAAARKDKVSPEVEEQLRNAEKENERLRGELHRRAKELQATVDALEEMKKGSTPDTVKTAMTLSTITRENASLQENVKKLKRQAETQERLLNNRQQHVDVLELALQEANTMHKKLDAERKAQIEELQQKLAMAEKMFEDLYNQSGAVTDRNRSSSHIVMPLRGGSNHNTPRPPEGPYDTDDGAAGSVRANGSGSLNGVTQSSSGKLASASKANGTAAAAQKAK